MTDIFEDITPEPERQVRWACPVEGCGSYAEGTEAGVVYIAEQEAILHTQAPPEPEPSQAGTEGPAAPEERPVAMPE